MLALISFLLVTIGSLNWFSIGILQYDFVAGIFGSQSNVFSRLIYALVGIASIVMVVNLIKNKGKFVVSFKKANKEYDKYVEEKEAENRKHVLATESEKDMFQEKHENKEESCCKKGNCECAKDTVRRAPSLSEKNQDNNNKN